VLGISSQSIYREITKEEKEMKQTNTMRLNLLNVNSTRDEQIQQMVSNTMYNNDQEIDRVLNEEDVIHEHEVTRKIDVQFGLDAFTFQHMMKY
jgi:hypothetical protein